MSSYLKNSFGFTSGAFNALNTGESGKGWGINTATFFEPVLGKVFNISHRGGIIIDFYSFVNMNPFEKLDFLIDVPIDITYFNLIQSDNLLFVYPKTSKIIEDNFQNTEFNCSVKCSNTGTQDLTIDFKINFKKELLVGPIVYNLIYTENIHKIPLPVFIKESVLDGQLNSKFNIISINGNVPQIDSNSAISNNHLDLTKLSIGSDATIMIKFEDLVLGIYYEFKLNLLNKLSGEQLETKVLDIIMEITPVDGAIFDIKDYVSGDTRNLICKDVSTQIDLPFKFQINGSMIGITPITSKAINIANNKLYAKRISYETEKIKGVFTLNIILMTASTSKDLNELKKLIPNPKHASFTLTNENFTNANFFNFEALLGNRIFDDYMPRINIEPTLNIETNYVNGINLKSTSPIPTPTNLNIIFKPEIGYYGSNGIDEYSSTINLLSDNNPNIDPLDVSPIIFNVSKNYCPPKNLYDFISAPNDYYKDLTFINSDNNLNISPNTQIVSVKTNLYSDIDIENKIVNGYIEVKHKTYTDDLNLDDFGNIIGYRKIPYTIKFEDYENDHNNLEISNIKIYRDTIKEQTNLDIYEFGFIGNLNLNLIKSGKIKIEIYENPTNTLPVNIYLDTDIELNKINIKLLPVGYQLIVDSTNYFPPINSTLRLFIKYINELNIETFYEQNIFFLKKEI